MWNDESCIKKSRFIESIESVPDGVIAVDLDTELCRSVKHGLWKEFDKKGCLIFESQYFYGSLQSSSVSIMRREFWLVKCQYSKD